MRLEITPENLLSMLGFSPTEHSIKLMQKIIESTKGFEKFAKHIVSLNDSLKHMDGFIAPSNSYNYLKIKLKDVSKEIEEEFNQKVLSWAKKYKIELQKVPNKNTYYIIGLKEEQFLLEIG